MMQTDEVKKALYQNTVKRLRHFGVEDPTAVIIWLAEECERYRAKIRRMELSIAMLQQEKAPLRGDFEESEEGYYG